MSKFSNLKLRYKIGASVATGAVVLGAAGGAFAYFSSTGTGSGTATAGGAGSIAISGTGVTGLTPGGSAKTLTATFTASGADSWVHTVTPTIPTATDTHGNTVVTTDGTTPVTGCLQSWFSVVNTGNVDHEIDLGSPQTLSTGNTIQLVNSAVDQSACESATIYVSYSSN